MNDANQFPIPTASYAEQSQQWPQSGRHILAHFDDETIIVYQAYRPEIGRSAAEHGYFGGVFKYTRMSWIKPNFLWMMYRSDWGRSKGQEVNRQFVPSRTFIDWPCLPWNTEIRKEGAPCDTRVTKTSTNSHFFRADEQAA